MIFGLWGILLIIQVILRTLADITFQQCISDNQNENLCCTLKIWSLRIGEGYLGKLCLYIRATAEILVKDQAHII